MADLERAHLAVLQLPRIVFELDYDWYGVPLRIEGLEIIPTRRLLSGSLRVTPQHNT